jgi:hypothetical protein
VIALAASVLLALYLIVPGFLFRFVFGLFVPLRTFVWTRTEEIYKAVITTILPFLLASSLAWVAWPFNAHPFSVRGNDELRRADYKLVASAFYSEQTFHASGEDFWKALTRSARRQGRLLVWYYGFVVGEALLLSFLILRYGKFKGNRVYSKFADTLLLPNISQWHVLLTPFIFPDRRATVTADVLASEGTLYQGTVSEYFLNLDGTLSGLILTGPPRRFDRRTYLQDKDKGTKKDLETYWKEIPSAKLFMFADKIENINLNYEPEVPSAKAVTDIVQRLGKAGTTYSITIQVGKPGDESPKPK